MAAANPDSGAFSVYTAKAYGPVAGAMVGWLWWLQLVVVIAAEALGAAGLLATIFPALPVWLMAFVFIVVLTALNLTSVKNFGEFEFWFALLKVAAIVGFLPRPTASRGSPRHSSWWHLRSAAPRSCPWRQLRPPSRPAV
jgi:AAT family amino acid transporter